MRFRCAPFVRFSLVCVLACLSLVSQCAAVEPLVITTDTQLDPNKVYGPLIVQASDITIDGQGAWVIGSTEGPTKNYRGTGITAAHVKNVTLRNIKAKGWETGLKLSNAQGCTVESCDFSDNFHDPDFGWGEQGRRGGIVLERVSQTTIKGNVAQRVWDACVLVESDGNQIVGNNFSRTSNTGLKLWKSSRNWIEKNDFSYGLRISPGEVHARDSTCVLIETGSNANTLTDNNCTHGGDGIFVRVLNGWNSSHNTFVKNDCSYANNNGVECWAPDNTFEGNKANHCSYGFWLGGSDRTVLRGNHASFNGLKSGFHNSPHLPGAGHAGIVFMFGPSSHTLAVGNVCEGNNGAGIAAIGDQGSQGRAWRAQHWILEQNQLQGNRWGIYLEFADWLDLLGNTFADNGEDVHQGAGVTRVTRDDELASDHRVLPAFDLRGPQAARVGEEVSWNVIPRGTQPGQREWQYQWDLGQGATADMESATQRFTEPGFFRLGVTVREREALANLAWRDFYVIPDLQESGTEGDADRWDFVREDRLGLTFRDDADIKLVGESAVHIKVDPYHGVRASALYPRGKDLQLPLAGRKTLMFWLKTHNPNLPGWQDVNPVVTLLESADRKRTLTPKADLLSQRPYNEAREGWSFFRIPLEGDKTWQPSGDAIETVNYWTIGVDSWDSQPLELWIDGVMWE